MKSENKYILIWVSSRIANWKYQDHCGSHGAGVQQRKMRVYNNNGLSLYIWYDSQNDTMENCASWYQ